MATSPFFPDVIEAWKAAPIIEGNQIPSHEFLDASSKFILIFSEQEYFFIFRCVHTHVAHCCILLTDRLGTVFSPVKSDIGNNIEQLKKASSQNADKKTLQKLVLAEKAAGKHKSSSSAASSLLWYSR